MADNSEVPKVEVRQQDLGSLTELSLDGLDSSYRYRWVYKAPLVVARKKAKGYELVDPSTDEVRNVVGDPIDAEDGTYTQGDVVLMRIKKTVYSERRNEKKRRTDARLGKPTRQFKKEAKGKVRARYGQDVEIITDKED